MSLYRQVKTLFTISSLIFTYIIWATVSNLVLDKSVNFGVYIISIFSVFLMQYFMYKKKRNILLLIPSIIAIAMNLLAYNVVSAGYNSIYIIFIIMLFNKIEYEEINYEIYKSRVKKSIYILIAIGGIIYLGDKALAQDVLRFYLIYLVSSIILLREARKYSSKITSKKSVLFNIAIILSVILLSMDRIYNFIAMILKYLWIGISFILNEIFIGISYIIAYIILRPLIFILKLLLSHLVNKGVLNNLKKNNDTYSSNSSNLLKQTDSGSGLLLVIILKIIVVIIIAFLLYKAYERYVKKTNSGGEGEVHKEMIMREKKSKESYLARIMKMFKRETDVRNKIFNIYQKFQSKMSDLEIYKPNMTASQLSSEAKTQIDHIEAINSLTSIYNEAKFSNHTIPEKNANLAKLNYEGLKKKL